MIFYEYVNPIELNRSENEKFNSYIFFDQDEAPQQGMQQDPNMMGSQGQEQMPSQFGEPVPPASGSEAEVSEEDLEMDAMRKYILIRKLRELKYKLEDNNVYIGELDILMKFINFISYETISKLSEKIIELSKSRKKDV